ncbi:MAG: hypothetical protein ACRDYC_01640, partial [Acidimicrobiales bacterium]
LEQRPHLGAEALDAARALTTSGHGVEVLAGEAGRHALVRQALTIEAAVAAWEASGHVVAVVGEPNESVRWQTLTGAGGDVRTGPTPTVLLVDGADRQPTARIAETLGMAQRFAAKVVLVEGGTVPRRYHDLSEGLGMIGDNLGRAEVGASLPSVAALTRSGRVAPGTAQAVSHLMQSWLDRQTAQQPAWLVGLGRAEAEALGQWAREELRAVGRLSGPEVEVRGRPFAAGDRVVALRQSAAGSRISTLQERTVAAGTVGRVLDSDPRRGLLAVDWGGRTALMDRHMARHLGHAYATTPGMLHLVAGDGLLLGNPLSLGAQTGRIVEAAVVAPRVPGRGLDDLARARRVGIESPGRGLDERTRERGLGVGLGLG